MSQPEKPTGAKTMNTLRYVIEAQASIGNISQRVLRCNSQSNAKYHLVFAKLLEVLSIVPGWANIQSKISHEDTKAISFETRLSNQLKYLFTNGVDQSGFISYLSWCQLSWALAFHFCRLRWDFFPRLLQITLLALPNKVGGTRSGCVFTKLYPVCER